MKKHKRVVIRDNRIGAIKRQHPWVFSGAIKSKDGCVDGDIVDVVTRKGEFLAVGYFQDSSIMVRLLSFEETSIGPDFWKQRIADAQSLRASLSLPSEHTNVYRLIHGEGDNLPGLIIDIYADLAVIQCHTIGMHMMRTSITEALQVVFGNDIKSIYIKSGNTLPADYAADHQDHFMLGETGEIEVKENGCKFIIDVIHGQKTGFFIDQRENRNLLRNHVSAKKVLNLFSYTGGFSIYALNGDAKEVVSVDASAKAIQLCDQNVALTEYRNHSSVKADVNSYLKEIEQDYFDIIIVDPPAFAKSARKSHNAIQAYKRVNAAAIRKIKKGGWIFTFSCSQVIDAALFYNTITAAAIETGRPCQVLHHLSQGPDHPVSIFHPEGKYLKGLVIKVD